MRFDVLIVCHEKDFNVLSICVEQIRKNFSKLNNIFILSNKNPNISKTIYISENRYFPYINIEKIKKFYKDNNPDLLCRSGWIYQQILKLLSFKFIPELTDSYIVIDSDTLFLRDIEFNTEKFYYSITDEYHIPYLSTIKKLLNIDETIGFSTISHHSIFNKKFLNEMVNSIEKKFELNLIDCILKCIDTKELSSLSEWDLYANYMITNHPEICEQRQLKWKDINFIPNENKLNEFKLSYDFVSCHSWLREKNMINYVYCHLGSIPNHLIDSFRSVDYVDPSSRIILVTDQKVLIDGVEVLMSNDIASSQTLKVLKMKLFGDDDNSLWRTSLFRIFLVRDCIKYLNLKNCYHFDSDVLLYEHPSKFSHLINDSDGLTMTYHTEDEMVFGFSNFGDINKIDKICDILFEIIFDEQKQTEYSVGMPNEMQLLGGIYKRRPDLIRRLDVLPNENGIVFDPSSYGQYFGGTPNGEESGWYGNHHVVGREIGNSVLTPIIIDNKPYVEKGGKKYPIVNLHIHSKNTERFSYHINSEVDLNIEKVYPGSEMLPYERYKLYSWVKKVKPKNILDIGCGIGGGTYYLSEALKKVNSLGKVYSCDPERGPSKEFLKIHDNVDYRSIYSQELISFLFQNKIQIDFIFFDGPEDPDVAMKDIISIENYIQPGCYFSMHDWEIVTRKYDGQISTKSKKIRKYMESNSYIWKPVEILDGVNSTDSVGLCLYEFLGK